MSNEMRDWQADEIQELKNRVAVLEQDLMRQEIAATKLLAQNTLLRKALNSYRKKHHVLR